jgi:hypothetical protein
MTTPAGIAHVYYYEGNRTVGSRDSYCCGVSDAEGTHSGFWPNTAYFCHKCGEVWGREVYIYTFDYQPMVDVSWAVESRRCPLHGDGQFLVGKPLDGCSADLLRREFLALSQEY